MAGLCVGRCRQTKRSKILPPTATELPPFPALAFASRGMWGDVRKVDTQDEEDVKSARDQPRQSRSAFCLRPAAWRKDSRRRFAGGVHLPGFAGCVVVLGHGAPCWPS